MTVLITILHVIICFILIIAVLLQSGKSADLAGAFGGGGSQSVFGPRGAANLLTRVTTACAILFMFTSMGLWILSGKGERSVVRGEETPVTETTAPAATETQPPAEQPADAAAAARDPEQKTEQKAEQKTEATEKKAPDKKNPVKK